MWIDREKIAFNFCVIAVLMKCGESLLLEKGFECAQSCHRDVPPYRALPVALMLKFLFSLKTVWSLEFDCF